MILLLPLARQTSRTYTLDTPLHLTLETFFLCTNISASLRFTPAARSSRDLSSHAIVTHSAPYSYRWWGRSHNFCLLSSIKSLQIESLIINLLFKIKIVNSAISARLIARKGTDCPLATQSSRFSPDIARSEPVESYLLVADTPATCASFFPEVVTEG